MSNEVTEELSQGLQQEIAQLQVVYDTIIEFLLTYSFQLFGAFLIFLLGYFIAAKIRVFVLRLCDRYKLDVTLSRYIAAFAKTVVIVMVLVICLNKIGVSITPLVAAIGAISLGAGLAVQGLLSNYGAGLNIIIARPFVVGDTITVKEVSGLVKDIHLSHTLLETEDQVQIMIPNRHIVGEIIHNSHRDTLLELKVGVSYSTDTSFAIEKLQAAFSQLPGISSERKPQVGIYSFADSSIELEVRYWVPTEKVNEMRFAGNKCIKEVFSTNNISIPFPQREVRMLENT